MSALQQSIPLTLILAITITGGYIAYIQYHPENVSGRTSLHHLLGVLGLAALVVALRYRARPLFGHQTLAGKSAVWHMTLGNLAPLIILLHSDFHFSSVVSIVTFLCLTILVVSGTASILTSSQLDTPDSPGQPRANGRQPILAGQYWVDLHVYFSAILLGFSLVHILVILYY